MGFVGGPNLYKVFLVEDEKVVREGIRDNINWEATDFIFCGEAPDGEIALPMIQEIKPDILVTDIKMPFMDGLQLSKIIRKNMPWIKIIILSGHDEFNFAREAISIGVTAYLLKPISSVELIKALNKVALQIENEKKEREGLEDLKNQLEGNIQLIRDKFLMELSLGAVEPLDAISRCEGFGIDIISKYYIVMIIEVELKGSKDCSSTYSGYTRIESLISGLVKDDPKVIKYKKSIEETVLIIKGDTPEELEESAYRLAQCIRHEVNLNTGDLLTIGIGSVKERIQGIARSFADADVAKSYKYIIGRNKIIGINDIRRKEYDKKELIKLDKAGIVEYLKYGEKSNIDGFLEDYMRSLGECALKSPIYTNYVFMDIVMTTAKFVDELGGRLEDLLPEIVDMENILAEIDSISAFKKYVQQVLLSAIDYRDRNTESKYGSIIIKAKDYINANFADLNISLNSVASYVSISPSHFSTIFSQETGETFIEYLTKTRIHKAMELLKTTNYKASEIAFKVGYSDPHYFSYTFKKVTGVTPKEYRCGIYKNGNPTFSQ